MAKIIEMISNVFLKRNNHEETLHNENLEKQEEEQRIEDTKTLDLSTVIDFVRELETYYTNDIFKQRYVYMNNSLTDNQAKFIKKKIQEYELSMNLITRIKGTLLKKEEELREIWGKSSYSFYSELEKAKLEDIFYEAFEIVKQITIVNVIPELDEIIINRLEEYKRNWNITIDIPKNTSLRIIEKEGDIDTYRFGDFEKKVIDMEHFIELLPEQLNAINKIKINISFIETATNAWIRCTSISRQQLEFLKKSTIFKNDWEFGKESEILYDIIDYSQIEYYIKAIMQLLLIRKEYLLITIINPNTTFINQVKDTVEVNNNYVKVIDKMKFILPEKKGIYEDNLQFAIVSRKQNLESITFQSYKDFISNFL